MKVGIAGYGIEGKANLAYWQNQGDDVTILDEKVIDDAPGGVQVVTGPEAFNDLSGYDFIVRTASLRPDRLTSAQKIWSATNEFFAHCPAPIIGVTGTKGKGTTSSLITSILRAAGRTVHLVGNIGVPALEVLPLVRSDDIVVFEISSFQLWDIEKSPHTAVVLMIEPDHQDVHSDMEEYVQAKANIRRYQASTDVCFYHPTNPLSRQVAEASEASLPRRYGIPDDGACYVKENTFFVRDQQICPVEVLRLVGQHNVENACAAISVAWEYTQDTSAITHGLEAFDGLPHRTKFIREVRGARYYDDNYSSAPGAAIAAMRSFSEPEILIMGGYDKHVAFGHLADAVVAQPNIKKILLIGETRHQLAAALDNVGAHDLYEIHDEKILAPIVTRASELATEGDVVVMSPACASFDMFKNFGDRGDQFIARVQEL